MKFYTILLILFSVFFCSNAYAKDLDYHNILIAYMSETGDTIYSKFVEDWMKAFRPQIWQQYENDEFALDERKEETKELIARDLKLYNHDDEYIIRTNVEFGDYDFDKAQFSFHPLTTANYYNIKSPWGAGSLPPSFQVSFVNPDIIDGLPMDKKKAKRFVYGRKYCGSINRNLETVIYSKYKSASADYKVKLVISKVQVIDQKDGNRIVYEVVNAPK